jgi:hypothetical protein
LKRLFHRDLEERDWEKIAGDIVQLAQAPLEAPTEEEARVVHEEYTGYAGASIPSMLHALRRFVERRNSAAKPAPVLPQFKPGDRVRERRLGRYGSVSRVCDNGLLDVKLDSPKFQYELFQPNELEHIEAPMPQFKVGDRVRLDKGEWNVPSGTEGVVMTASLDDLEDVDFRPAAPRIFVPRNRLHLVEPAFKVGDRVRIENFPGSLQGLLGYVHKVVSESDYIVRHDDGLFRSVHTSWLRPAPQFKIDQRVRVRATGQVGCVKAVRIDGRFMVEGSAYRATELEPAPFKLGDRVRWKLSSSLPFCHGTVVYLLDEKVGMRIDGQVVEVAERLLEADPTSFCPECGMEEFSKEAPDRSHFNNCSRHSSYRVKAASPAFRVGDRVHRKSDGACGRVAQVNTSGLLNVTLDNCTRLDTCESGKFEALMFRIGDRVKWKGTTQTGVVSAVLAFGRVDVALEKGGWLSNYSPDGFELLGPVGTRRFVEDLASRMAGTTFTHEEAELLRLQIALRERTASALAPCPFCSGIGKEACRTMEEIASGYPSRPRKIECSNCGVVFTGESRQDCKSKWERRTT